MLQWLVCNTIPLPPYLGIISHGFVLLGMYRHVNGLILCDQQMKAA